MNFWVAFGLGSGLAGACAFRLFFPLILTGLFVRFAAGVTFPPALNWLSSSPVLIILLLGMILEFVLDFSPGTSFFHSSMYSIVKVIGGAILFNSIAGWNPWLGIPVGGMVTGFFVFSHLTVIPWFEQQHHFWRRMEYPYLESLFAIVWTILALAAPLLSLVATGFAVYAVIRIGRNVV